jgi:tRNA(Ile)-lysidine synthase
MELEKTVKNNIIEYNLTEKGDLMLVGFSGGPDSTALLHILKQLSQPLKFSLAACYINHMIRPRSAKKEIEYCWSFCQKLKIDFHLINEDIPALAKELKISVEAAGHKFRRAALRQLALEDDYTKIALGHHKDDLIESVLFRLFRGTGPQGLNPIRPKNDLFIRPLFNIERKDIEAYCRKNKLAPIIDRSNFDPKYSRNYVRHKIIPVVDRHFGDKYKNAVFNFSRIITEENGFLHDLAAAGMKKVARFTPGGKVVVDSKALAAYDDWLKRRIVKSILESMAGYIGYGTFSDIESVLMVIDGRKKTVSLEGQIRITADRSELIFTRGNIRIYRRQLKLNESTNIDEINSRIICREIPEAHAVIRPQKKGARIHVDLEKVSWPMYITGIKPGDRFRPLGMKGTKKIGDFLTDIKVPAILRDEIPVLHDRKGIVWLVGHQIADRIKIRKSTKKVLEIERFEKRKSRRFGRT